MTLVIAVLTGQRPDLLTRTLDAFTTHHRQIWDDATRVVFHNTGDQPTADVLDRYQWHERNTHHGQLLPIGKASDRLLDLAVASGAEVVLRLEDDWEAQPGDWWDDAFALLDHGLQVRLRRSNERVSPRCFVCRKQTVWREVGGHRVGHAHYTHNPSLVRVEHLKRMAGTRNERDAMRRLHGQDVAQHVPGVFAHIGGWSLKVDGGGAP